MERMRHAEAGGRIVWLKDGRSVALRAAGSGDVPAVQQFVRGLSDQSRRNRFFTPIRELSSDQLERLTRSHPPGELALVGEALDGAAPRIVAMAQYVVCDPLDAEFAVVVDDAWQRQGLGIQLLNLLADCAAESGLAALNGFVLADNWPMLELLARLDCDLDAYSDPHVIRAVKRLTSSRAMSCDFAPERSTASGIPALFH